MEVVHFEEVGEESCGHQKDDHWETNGRGAIWVGRSDEIHNGHVVVPIVWKITVLSKNLNF